MVRTGRCVVGAVVVALIGAFATSASTSAQPPPATAAACPRVLVPSARFTDTTGSLAKREIDCIVWWELMSGTAPRRFSPRTIIDRGSAAAVLVRVIRLSGDARPPASVRDVAAVRPDDPITRGRMAAMLEDTLREIFQIEPETFGPAFTDASAPNAVLTRASSAIWVTQALGLAVASGQLEVPVRIAPRSLCSRPAPRTAAGYQAMFDQRWGAWGGADGAQSIPLPDGRTMWNFNDTLQGHPNRRGEWKDGWRLIRNSVLIQDGGCLTPLLGPDRRDTIPRGPAGEFYWPGNGIVDGDHIYAHAWRLRPVDQPLFEFEILGSHLLMFEVPEPGRNPKLEAILPTPTSDWRERGPKVGWGTALWSDGRFVYVYGIRGRTDGIGNELHVARVPVGQLRNLAAWEFRTEDGWSSNARASTNRIADGTYLEGFSIGPWGDGVVIVSKENGFFGDEIRTWTAASPAGHFRRRRQLPMPARNTERHWYYTANHHPQLELRSGRTLASVSRNTDSWETLLSDALLYKPQFREVPMPGLAGETQPAPLQASVEIASAPLRRPTTVTVVVTAGGEAAVGRPVQVRSGGQLVGAAHTDASGLAHVPVASVPADLTIRVFGGTGQPDTTVRATITPAS